jgi:glycosyltransferase involved in cell wall biosynthesis
VLFVGYAEGALGLGQAFRANLAAAASAAIPFGIYPLRAGIETRLIEPYMPERYDDTHAYDICLIEVAADQLPAVFRTLDPCQLDESYKVLVPYWELAAAPQEWREKLRAIDEIWAPNGFIAKAFAHVFTGPILVMPPAMEPSGDDYPARAHYGLEESRFYFMFSFDYYSSPFRKNPLGVIEAFQEAFPGGHENVGLVIKSTGAPEHYPELKMAIRRTMNRDVRIRLLDHNMSRRDMLGLIHAADAYVSLHRSEGFGLGMAEALSFGRIVIGTDYSGSTDFLNEQTGYPVPYLLRRVLPHEYHYSDRQFWAEPDLAEAVEIMRKVVADPEEARRRGSVGRSFVRERYGVSPVGRLIKARLDKLANARSMRARRSAFT